MKKFFIRLLVIIGICAGVFLFLWLVKFVYCNSEKFNANIVVALIAGTVTFMGYFVTRFLEKKKLIEQQIREQKLPAYEEFIEFLFIIFKKTKNNKPISNKEIEEFYWSMNKKSILWLSDKTLKSYANWKALSIKYADLKDKSPEDSITIMLALEQMLLDFRRDIGHKNSGIEKGEILSLFLTDLEKYKEQLK